MDWHSRYVQQAGWTAQLRAYLFKKVGLTFDSRVLEVGCGTGAILADLPTRHLNGLDINYSALKQAVKYTPNVSLTLGDGARLPYASHVFDMSFCHFVLLWAGQPRELLTEMRRVVSRGGAVLALAEPDYGGRIDFPSELIECGHLQIESLKRQGADPEMGRKLGGLFFEAGIEQVQVGILGGEWYSRAQGGDLDLEWEVLANDLSGDVDSEKVNRLKNIDQEARRLGKRILYVPTFYAWGVA